MKKAIPYLTTALLSASPVLAEGCGITNLSSCLPQKFYEYTLSIINAPLQPLLTLIKNLLSEPVNLSLFSSIWAIMVYVISIFYGLLLLYAGVRFMVSGHDVQMREDAKNWLRSIFLMIIFIQSSFFLYSMVVEINSILTTGVLNMVDDTFFLLTADNLVNIGLELIFGIVYLLQLLLTVVLLLLRYVIVALGVVIIPFGIFFFFIPPLKEYGMMILNFLGVIIFVTFFDSLIFLISNQLLTIDIFDNIKILIMTTAFSLANFLMFYLILFAAIKSAFKHGKNIAKVAVSAAKYMV